MAHDIFYCMTLCLTAYKTLQLNVAIANHKTPIPDEVMGEEECQRALVGLAGTQQPWEGNKHAPHRLGRMLG